MQPTSQPAAPPTAVWDVVRAGLVVASAFLVASFPAHNSDIWRHLATGRALLHGDYRFGTDPFSYTTDGAVWVNHAWLFDVAAYGLHQSFGGPAVVVAKALLVAVLALVLLHLCWRGPLRWLAMLLILLGLAALGPFVVLRPMSVSLVFVAITYAWLERHATNWTWRASWPLLLLFAVWANVDEWFVLGPVLVALWWLGDSLAALRERAPNPPATSNSSNLILLAVAGLAVALLNPHHVRVFTMPALLDQVSVAETLDDAADRAAFDSPLTAWHGTAGWPQPPRLAGATLVLVGLVSFLLAGDRLPYARLVIWIVLLALGLYRSGLMPLFVVVAGPMAALNFQEWWARRPTADVPVLQSRLVRIVVQLGSIAVFAAAGAAAWAGWARQWPGEPPRWALEVNPSLEAAARQLGDWHEQGKLEPEARGLPTSAAAANVLAWVSPSVKSFCDDRPHLFAADIRADFVAMRRALFSVGDDAQDAREWRALLAAHGITHLIADHDDDDALALGLRRLFASPSWSLYHLRGRTTIFVKRGTELRIAAQPVDAAARAFAPSPDEVAPTAGPIREPEPRVWIDDFDRPPPAREPGRDECLLWQTHFESQRPRFIGRVRDTWSYGLSAAIVGLPAAEMASAGMPLGGLVRGACLTYSQSTDRSDQATALYALSSMIFRRFVGTHDDGPPGSLLLAVRAGRRALAQTPDDARTQLYLGQCYLRLRQQTRERATLTSFAPLEHLRRIQAAAVLRQALRLDPESLIAHELLARLYHEIGFYDLALEHMQAYAQRLQAEGQARGESAEQFRQRLDYWQDQEKQLARQVRDAQLAVRGQKGDALETALTALNHQLPGQALTLLSEAGAAVRGRDGTLVLLDLLLHTGEVRQVREVLEAIAELPERDQDPFRWLQVYLAGARGDYAALDRELESILGPIEVVIPEVKGRRVDPRVALGVVLGAHLLDQAAKLPYTPIPGAVDRAGSLALHLRQLAEVSALRGLMALEAGDINSARQHLRRSLQFFDHPDGAGGLARHYLEMLP